MGSVFRNNDWLDSFTIEFEVEYETDKGWITPKVNGRARVKKVRGGKAIPVEKESSSFAGLIHPDDIQEIHTRLFGTDFYCQPARWSREYRREDIEPALSEPRLKASDILAHTLKSANAESFFGSAKNCSQD